MRNETRQAFNLFRDTVAQLNGIDNVAEKFDVSPSVQQKLETHIQESSAFLSKINVLPVGELKGEKVGIGISGPIASRTDTTQGERVPRDVSTLDSDGYECKQTNYDTALRYAKLDAWAKFPDFQTRIRDAIVKRQALDRMLIGFNGTSAAAATKLADNPLLQDVNIGWLAKFAANAPAQVMTGGATAGAVKVGGEDADFKTLDGLVFDLVSSVLAPWYREDPGLVAILSRELMTDKLFPLVDGQSAPTEKLAADIVVSQRRLGGLPAVTVPYFPAGSILVTTYDNLSIYYQEGARRRALIDNPKRDQIENFESSNDAYVVEDYQRGALVTNITVAA